MGFRGVLAVVCGLVSLGFPASASAKYAFCKTHAPRQSVRVTPVFEYPARVGSDGIDPDFETYIEAKLGFNVYPSCMSYADEAQARKMQAYTLAETAQDLPAILDHGFETYLAQKYGGPKTKPAPIAVAGAGQNVASKTITPAGPSAAQLSADRHKAVEERNRAAQEKYEAELAEQKRKVDEYERAQTEVARKKAEQAAAAQAALAAHDAQLAVAAEAQRKHEADLAKYEQEVAAQKLRKDFDERHKLGQASTDTDANQCVTTPETQLNASFQGNTAASVINGCGKPVDVRICLMTDKGWNCGVTYGLGSQQRWSHSSFNATGQVFSDARPSGSSRALSSPS